MVTVALVLTVTLYNMGECEDSLEMLRLMSLEEGSETIEIWAA